MDWIKEELLGTGSFGRVFKAKEKKSGKTVVIKEIPLDLVGKREVAFMKSLNHPHIIK